ncbi:hypothetical protein LTR62_001049 [Meristemomyces frigidus]|uniref:Uncharacterized protein n=1 Tax=Meristemomyces frigidus TaxID=1508187 RepID=A0AAN7T9K1_9PEZI|nr:hypothetical protein LTR62_001049 [Meristemomyces frigidus]
MSSLVRGFKVYAADDGLYLHPSGRESSICIAYGSTKISSATHTKDNDVTRKSLDASGLVGILDLVSSSYLVVITRSEEVARIDSKAIYAIKDVALVPLSSQTQAEQAVIQTTKSLSAAHARKEQPEESEIDDDEHVEHDVAETHEPAVEVAALQPPKDGPLQKGTSFVKNVVLDKGSYGRFATKWFTKGGSSEGSRPQQGTRGEKELTHEQIKQTPETQIINDDAAEAKAKSGDQSPATVRTAPTSKEEDEAKKQSFMDSLAPRIVRSVKLYFSASGFFFSYDHDLSGALTQRDNTDSSLPWWKRFDKLYFWNRHLLESFITADQNAFVLPLMQGFVGQRTFSIARTDSAKHDTVVQAAQAPEDVLATQAQTKSPDEAQEQPSPQEEFVLTLISRRSIKRAGLRYLRRGIDKEGSVANSVETEQMLSPKDPKASAKTFSLLQYRGSIPLYFSQTPYSFKPLPVLFGSETSNQEAFRKHFSAIQQRYGSVQVASLIDKHGTEVTAGETYEKHAKLLNEHDGVDGRQLAFEWFDFHSQCKGMKFENVSILLKILQDSLKSFGWVVKQDGRNIQQQKGIIRTNCMDCLDRTNVVQSAIGGWALQQQLLELGLDINLKTDPKTQWFNTLWADNGDFISKQYAGTSALKGDFTRTRKRNWTGALSDFSLTLSRAYNNIFGDYFLQLNIDYLLGNVGPTAFEEFETTMLNQDHPLDMSQVRLNAIDRCVKLVVEDPQEAFVAGWTLSCPKEANTIRTLPFEECVLLLTGAALYFCRFDWDAEKVGSFERVELVDITELWRGAYVTSTLGPTQTDEEKNVGFAFRYLTRGEAVVRTNTRSLENEKEAKDESVEKSREAKDEGGEKIGKEKQVQLEKDGKRLLAFKALPLKDTAMKYSHGGAEEETAPSSEKDLITHLCAEIHSAILTAAKLKTGTDPLNLENVPVVEERDVLSLAEAKKSTGYVESVGYSLKKLVWA